MLVDKQTYFENYHHQKKPLARKELKSYVCTFTILSCSAFNSAFTVNVASFVFKLESFGNIRFIN